MPSFCQKYGNMWSFAKNMELYEVLPKIWNYIKFCRNYGKYGVMPSFCQKYGNMWSFAKNMELYEVLPKI
jgi:hypothetical protein